MLVAFEELSDQARVWIYQSDRALATTDVNIIESKATSFFSQWAAHGASLKSSFKIVHNKFLVIAVDESHNQASGCSIDASVTLIQSLESELNINFFDRTKVCFLLNDEIFECSMNEIKSLIDNNTISANTLTFNNLVSNIDYFNKEWLIPSGQSWLKRYFS